MEPYGLRAGEEELAVVRWTQHVDVQALADRCGEGGAVGRAAGTAVIRGAVGFACFPVDVYVRLPELVDVHAVEHMLELEAIRCDEAAAWSCMGRSCWCGWRGNGLG